MPANSCEKSFTGEHQLYGTCNTDIEQCFDTESVIAMGGCESCSVSPERRGLQVESHRASKTLDLPCTEYSSWCCAKDDAEMSSKWDSEENGRHRASIWVSNYYLQGFLIVNCQPITGVLSAKYPQ